MNFITFSVGTTNIFPMANSTMGGQYATEFNLRTRESVCTPQAVQYMIGPSYVHGEEDFKVSYGSSSRTGTISIAPGRGVINGHFIQNLAPMEIDMAAARSADPSLVGKLCIGLKVMYSTLPTMAGTILVEDIDQLYEGIQVVVLPESEFKLPVDSPTDENGVTAHIKLAEFMYRNGQISGVINNYPGKCQTIESIRIAGSGDEEFDTRYVSKAGLNPRNLYVFAGKGTELDSDRFDTWCAAQDSLMVWDANTQLGQEAPVYPEATFVANSISGTVDMYLPHKQLDYSIYDTHGNPLFYQPRITSLPVANYTTGAPGTVGRDFIDQIKDKFTELGRYQAVPGSQILYINELHSLSDLPGLNPTTMTPGSYILVGHDYTVIDDSDTISPPATMYVIQKGEVTVLQYYYSSYFESEQDLNSLVLKSEIVSGFRIAAQTFDPDEVCHDPEERAANNMWAIGTGGVYHGSANDYLIGITNRSTGYELPDGALYNPTMVEDGALRVDAIEYNFYRVVYTGPISWTDPLWITAQIPLATESAVGGFLNVPDSVLDQGYVYRDDTGHLRLLDYELLRTGTLAYRLGSDVSLTGLTMDALQAELDDRVNERIAYPTAAHIATRASYGLNPNVIELTLELSDDANVPVIYVRGIDSRFGASVYLHITGTATSATQLVISNCQKIRIDNNMIGSPTILINNCGLYYDPIVLDKLDTITGLSLWYESSDDSQSPYLSVNGLTVSTISPQITPEEIDFWTVSDPNDNHFEYALRSITFNTYGKIVEASIMIRNNSTYNVDPGQTIYVSDFRLPQGTTLTYPRSCLTKQIRITGTFISAYYSTPDTAYVLTDNAFTAVSQTYEAVVSEGVTSYEEHIGTLSLYANTIVTSSISGTVDDTPFTAGSAIDGWDPSSFHVFSGGIVS